MRSRRKAGKAANHYLAADASAAGAAAGAAEASAAGAAGAAAGAGAAGAAASSFLPQADRAAAAMMAAKTRDLFMVIFLMGLKQFPEIVGSRFEDCLDRDKSTRALSFSVRNYIVFPRLRQNASHKADAKPSNRTFIRENPHRVLTNRQTSNRAEPLGQIHSKWRKKPEIDNACQPIDAKSEHLYPPHGSFHR